MLIAIMLSSSLHVYGLSYPLQMVRVFSSAIVCNVQQQWLALHCIVGIFGRFKDFPEMVYGAFLIWQIHVQKFS